MAFVSLGWRFSVTLIDNGGNTTTKTYELNSADAAEAATDGAAIITQLGLISDARPTSYHTYVLFADDALTLPAAGVQIENLAMLSFTVDGNPTKHPTHTVPAPKIGIFNAATGPGANIVNVANAQILDYAKNFITGVDQIAYLSDGETMVTFDSGRRIHRASRRG